MTKIAFGITSKCQDGNHIYMGDIDIELKDKDLYEFTSDLMTDNFLSHMVILNSSSGYNLFSLDKVPLKFIHRINKKFNLIDPQFNDIAYFTRQFYVLRMGVDKSVNMILWNYKNPVHIRSNAHRIFFNGIFDLNLDKNKFFDDYDMFQVIKFKNSKHGWELI